jgi:hypothetical protein
MVEVISHEAFIRSAGSGGETQASNAAARREAEYEQHIFFSKAQRFVALWHSLTEEMNERKTFNVKLARQVSKAFHDLEKTDGWKVAGMAESGK